MRTFWLVLWLLATIASISPANAQVNIGIGSSDQPPAFVNGSMPLTQVVKRSRNSVVFIEAEFVDKSNGAIAEAHGTGFVVSSDGYVLTAGHLFEGMDTTTSVFGRVGSRYAVEREELEIISISRNPDGALLKFRNTGRSRLPVTLGNPSTMEDGSVLYVMGFPGKEEWFQDQGSLSGKGGPLGSWSTTISFEPGISGAPVLNDKGQVVAVAWGGDPDSVGTLNRLLPINLFASLLRPSGLEVNANPASASLSPLEQIAKRRSEGLLLQDGAPAFPMFDDGTTRIVVSLQGDYVLISVRAPENQRAKLHVLPGGSSYYRGAKEIIYAIRDDDKPCIRSGRVQEDYNPCGHVVTSATVNVHRERTRQGRFLTLTWRLSTEEIGPFLGRGTASIAVSVRNGFVVTNGYHLLKW